MNHPVEALRAARGSLAEGGSVVIGDERVADRFATPVTSSSASTTAGASCTASRSACSTRTRRERDGDPPRHRPRLRRDAGFRLVDVLPIENDFWRFYRLVP